VQVQVEASHNMFCILQHIINICIQFIQIP
jgi:hypothetical protein